MIILGINSYHPDSSAALIVDGKLTAAVEEERLTRVKHFAGLPAESIKYCLKESGLSIKDVDCIAIPRKPGARILRKAFYGLKIPALAGKRISGWGAAFDIKKQIAGILNIDEMTVKAKIAEVEHHRAHIASSFFVSGFDKAFLCSMDALGDFGSTMWGEAEGNSIKVLGEVSFPHSLGYYYTAITQYLGFTGFGDEYKVMGLAPYGEPAFEDEFKKILKVNGTSFRLGLEYFAHHKRYIEMSFEDGYPEVDMIFSPYLEKRLGKRRFSGEPIEKRHKDIARSLQNRLEEVILHILDSNGVKNSYLCLAGGVAFNCAANGKIFNLNKFKNIYIPPAAGDAGLAIGAAFYLWHNILNNPRGFVITHASWGPAFEDAEKLELEAAKNKLIRESCSIEKIEDEDGLCRKTAEHIADGKIVGWFQGRMEFGPRALGNRSILADPRREDMKEILNSRIKHRESFRPFAPSVLEEDAGKFFECGHPSPFMSFVYKVKDEMKKSIPAVVHVDGTARVQTVSKNTNIRYWKLINEFKRLTGIPILLNTSFNDNEPIICRPQEAIDCFLRTRIDVLVLGNTLIYR